MKKLLLLLFASAVVLTPLAAEAGYNRRSHRSYRVPAERIYYSPHQWNVWRVPIWTVPNVEVTHWGYGTYDSEAPKLYYNHQGEAVSGRCVVVDGWTTCGVSSGEATVIIQITK